MVFNVSLKQKTACFRGMYIRLQFGPVEVVYDSHRALSQHKGFHHLSQKLLFISSSNTDHQLLISLLHDTLNHTCVYVCVCGEEFS